MKEKDKRHENQAMHHSGESGRNKTFPKFSTEIVIGLKQTTFLSINW